jgi:hypothetical protein
MFLIFVQHPFFRFFENVILLDFTVNLMQEKYFNRFVDIFDKNNWNSQQKFEEYFL